MSTENTKPGERGRVLFADDDRAGRESLVQMLLRLGFACEGVASGEAAADRLRMQEFDVLLSDIHMPGNTGLELIEALPELAAGLPVILLTGRPSVETAARSVRLPVFAYLTKPPDIAELARLLDQAVADCRGFRALHAGRERLRVWEQELALVEQRLRQSPGTSPGGLMGHYLRLSLRQVILTLADMEKVTTVLEQGAGGTPAQVDHVAALQRTVEVLERTKQNFKSKELADLRRQLEQLLGRERGSRPPV